MKGLTVYVCFVKGLVCWVLVGKLDTGLTGLWLGCVVNRAT